MEFLLSNRKVLALCLAIVAFVSFAGVLGYLVFAAEPIPATVQNAWKTITDNQKFIDANRPVVNEWNARKTDNAVQVGIMHSNCYDYSFADEKPVKIPDCVPSFL